MRILIDLAALAPDVPPERSAWWRTVLGEALPRLQGHEIYLLNRTWEATLDVQGPVQLYAPVPDASRPALEDRRLAALCWALRVDTFLSTAATTAGTRVRTVTVARSVGLRSRRAPRFDGAALWLEAEHRGASWGDAIASLLLAPAKEGLRTWLLHLLAEQRIERQARRELRHDLLELAAHYPEHAAHRLPSRLVGRMRGIARRLTGRIRRQPTSAPEST